jgi:hypothetical protein
MPLQPSERPTPRVVEVGILHIERDRPVERRESRSVLLLCEGGLAVGVGLHGCGRAGRLRGLQQQRSEHDCHRDLLGRDNNRR